MQSCHPSVLPVKCEYWVVLFLIVGIVIDCFDWLWTLDMKTLLIHDSSMNHDDVAGVDECLTPPYSSVNSSTGSPCSTVTDSQGPQSPLFQDDLSPVAIEGLFCLTHRVPTPPGKSWKVSSLLENVTRSPGKVLRFFKVIDRGNRNPPGIQCR